MTVNVWCVLVYVYHGRMVIIRYPLFHIPMT